MSKLRYGVDLGGTKIEIVALNDHNRVVYQQRTATPKGDYAQTLQAIAALYQTACAETGALGSLGVGMPGAVSHKTGLIKNANSTWLIGKNLQADLQALLQQPVRLANDANCFALSEASDGAAAGAEGVFGVILGTGCGGGVVVKGQLVNGANAIGGEWGHNPLPWQSAADEALPCYCGQRGCNETYLSGSGFSAHYQQRTAQRLSVPEILDLATQGQAEALQLMDDYATWLAKGLASVINVLDPDVIVLGGGMSNCAWLYERVPQKWGQWVFSDQVETQLRPPKWGDSSGVRGAAWLWP